jgi:hypothetical protein
MEGRWEGGRDGGGDGGREGGREGGRGSERGKKKKCHGRDDPCNPGKTSHARSHPPLPFCTIATHRYQRAAASSAASRASLYTP